jgi:hypothetical protein
VEEYMTWTRIPGYLSAAHLQELEHVVLVCIMCMCKVLIPKRQHIGKSYILLATCTIKIAWKVTDMILSMADYFY